MFQVGMGKNNTFQISVAKFLQVVNTHITYYGLDRL